MDSNCAPNRDNSCIEAIFSALGSVAEVEYEEFLHAVTVISVSSPAFALFLLEHMIEGGL